MSNPTKDSVRKIILNVLEMEADEIEDAAEFKSLGVNSLMALDILTDLEREFKIKFPEKLLRRFTSIDSIHALVEENLAQRDQAPESHTDLASAR